MKDVVGKFNMQCGNASCGAVQTDTLVQGNKFASWKSWSVEQFERYGATSLHLGRAGVLSSLRGTGQQVCILEELEC